MHDFHSKDRFASEPLSDPPRTALFAHNDELVADATDFRVYLSETDSTYTLKAAVPGACTQDINVRIDGYEVSITNNVTQASPATNNGRTPARGAHAGVSCHSVWLDCPVDDSGLVMNCHDGVLELSLPKATTPRRAGG